MWLTARVVSRRSLVRRTERDTCSKMFGLQLRAQRSYRCSIVTAHHGCSEQYLLVQPRLYSINRELCILMTRSEQTEMWQRGVGRKLAEVTVVADDLVKKWWQMNFCFQQLCVHQNSCKYWMCCSRRRCVRVETVVQPHSEPAKRCSSTNVSFNYIVYVFLASAQSI